MNKLNLHSVQAGILRELLFHNGTNFASLNKTDLTSDHFTFHLKKLVADGLVEKKATKYYLTQQGKVLAGTLDVDSLQIETWGKASVAVTAKKEIDGVPHYLIQQRLKEPFYGYYGFINGKVRYGDTSEDTAIRELQEETGLTGTPIHLCVYHKLRGPDRQHVTLDNYFFVYLVKDPIGELQDTAEGKNFWKTAAEIRALQTFPGFDDALDIVLKEEYRPYFEKFFVVEQI